MPKMFRTDQMTRAQANRITKLHAAHEAVEECRKMLAKAEKNEVRAMAHASDAGIPDPTIASIVGMSKGRVWQLRNNYTGPSESE